MKRVGFLIERIADMDNLRLAFYKAQKGKRGKREIIEYRNNLQQNLKLLHENVLSGEVQVGEYHLFKIFDPKERVVCAAHFNERVLHHAIMNVCAPYFEKHFIATTYANRENKGVYKALELAHLATARHMFVAKLDVRKYFDTINHAVLKQLLKRLFKDKCLLQLLGRIIDSYSVEEGRGLPIGNLTSQYFANYYLSGLDHYAKEVLAVPIYIRYMDDVLLFGDDRKRLQEQVNAVIYYASECLHLRMKSPIVQPTSIPIAFLGYRLKTNYIGLTQRSRKRFEKKYGHAIKMWDKGRWSEEMVQAHVLPLLAFVRYAYTKKYRNVILEKVENRRGPTA